MSLNSPVFNYIQLIKSMFLQANLKAKTYENNSKLHTD